MATHPAFMQLHSGRPGKAALITDTFTLLFSNGFYYIVSHLTHTTRYPKIKLLLRYVTLCGKLLPHSNLNLLTKSISLNLQIGFQVLGKSFTLDEWSVSYGISKLQWHWPQGKQPLEQSAGYNNKVTNMFCACWFILAICPQLLQSAGLLLFRCIIIFIYISSWNHENDVFTKEILKFVVFFTD